MAFIKGGEGGSSLKPGDPDTSEILTRVKLPADDADRMPPKKHGEPLSSAEIETLAAWIKAGAPWPDGEILAPKAKTALPRWDAPPDPADRLHRSVSQGNPPRIRRRFPPRHRHRPHEGRIHPRRHPPGESHARRSLARRSQRHHAHARKRTEPPPCASNTAAFPPRSPSP